MSQNSECAAQGGVMSSTAKAQRTPGKWMTTKAGPVMQGYSQGDAIFSIEHNTLIAGCFSDVRGGADVAEANAAFIVTACNSHDPMLADIKALREALRLYLSTYVDTQSNPTPVQEVAVMVKTRDALQRTAHWEEV